MNRKACIWLIVFALAWVGLAAQNTTVTIGRETIVIPQPENSAPALTRSEIREIKPSDSDGMHLWAAFGKKKDVKALTLDDSIPVLPDPLFMVIGVAELDNESLDHEQLQVFKDNVDSANLDLFVVPITMKGMYWESDFGAGFTVELTRPEDDGPMVFLMNLVLIKGKMLIVYSMQNYPDDATLEALQATTIDWAEKIYVANGGVLSDEDWETGYEQVLAELDNVRSTTAASLSGGFEDREVDFVPYDDPPVIIGKIAPDYPDFAKRAHVEGVVILEVEVYDDGVVGEIRVMRSVQSGPGGLDEAAIAAVRSIRFQPGKSAGKPVNTTVIIPIEFKLN